MKEIKTNYREDRYEYLLCNGDSKEGWVMMLQTSPRESVKEMYERLAAQGWTRISFYETSTRVKGIHNIIAYVK